MTVPRRPGLWLIAIFGAATVIFAVTFLRPLRPEPVGPGASFTRIAETSTATPSAALSTLWVLTVGVNRYADAPKSLRFTESDARAIAEVFARQRDGELYGDVKTKVLVDREATRESILRALGRDFLGQAAPIDVGVIYLAGHGVWDEEQGRYYFLPVTASSQEPNVLGLDMSEFNTQLEQLHRNMSRLVVVLDTCRAGAAARAGRVRIGPVPDEGLYVLASARSTEESVESASLGHGVFTYALLEGLEGAAADQKGLISVFRLADHTEQEVPRLTDNRQHPVRAVYGSDLVLARRPGQQALTASGLNVQSARAGARPNRSRVAIADFENLRPDPASDWLEALLGEYLATAFSTVTEFDVLDEKMVRFLTRGTPDVIEAVRRAGAEKFVEGRYWVDGDHVTIAAQVKNVTPLERVASETLDGPLDRASELTGQLAVNLLNQLGIAVGAEAVTRIRSLGRASLTARRRLLDAERPAKLAPHEHETPPSVPSLGSSERIPLGALFLARAGYAAEAHDAEAELRAVLEGYRLAFTREDVAALSGYYVTFPEGQRAALVEYFELADGLQVDFHDIVIAIIGDQAAVSLLREDRFTDHETGEAQHIVTRLTKLFNHDAQGWRIAPEQ